MATEQRLIDANDVLLKTFTCDEVAEVRKLIENAPTVDAVVVEDKELLKAIKMLIKQYEHSKRSDYVHSPVAHAFYHAWKQLDERRKGE